MGQSGTGEAEVEPLSGGSETCNKSESHMKEEVIDSGWGWEEVMRRHFIGVVTFEPSPDK